MALGAIGKMTELVPRPVDQVWTNILNGGLLPTEVVWTIQDKRAFPVPPHSQQNEPHMEYLLFFFAMT